MSLLHVSAPAGSGPGERQQMLDEAAAHFASAGVARSQVLRVDVPGRGGGGEGTGVVRVELEPAIPLLQSGSLFGERQGLEVVDAQNLVAGEGEILADLLAGCDLSAVEVVLLAMGSLPRPLAAVVKELGTTKSVSRIWERQAQQWLRAEIRDRGLVVEKGGEEALLQRFGTDTAALGQALDQLEEAGGKISKEMIVDRFRNRPDEPAFRILDAIGRGDSAEALRRLSDFLVHDHPLVFLAAVEFDLKRRALAAAAPDEGAFREWIGAGSADRGAARMWRQRGKVRESSLRRAQEALVRADRVVKSHPEEVHRVTLERLTVALCRWYR